MPGPTVVVAALPEEVGPLLARLSDREPVSRPPGRPSGARPWIVRGRLGGRPVAVVATGDGEANARAGIRRALEGVAPSRLLVIGVAGAVDPGLPAGALLVAGRVVEEDGRTYVPDGELTRRLLERGARPAVMATLTRLADSTEAREAVRAAGLGGPAAPAPDAVDLETAVYAAEAERRGIPWAVVRAVSDAFDERLPAYLETCRGEGGEIRRARVLLHACLRPWTIATLLRLRRRVRDGAARLAGVVEDAVAVGVPRRERARSGSRESQA